MTKRKSLVLIIATVFIASCGAQDENTIEENIVEAIVVQTPKEMLNEAYQLFKEGDDEASIKLANEVLEMGRATNNDTLIGKALTSLCRNSQRSLDTIRLSELSAELIQLSASSGDKKWIMYQAHMNAEMWRLIGDMDKAEAYYDESMSISSEIGATGMFTIDHFNKSFVSSAKGDFEEARNLIKSYYRLKRREQAEVLDPYGLIALAYLLKQEQNYYGAHEVALVTRRLFKEQNIFPEPPDEKPLLEVEEKVKEELKESALEEISVNSASGSVLSLLKKYLR